MEVTETKHRELCEVWHAQLSVIPTDSLVALMCRFCATPDSVLWEEIRRDGSKLDGEPLWQSALSALELVLMTECERRRLASSG